jgi:hypothetical protein
VQPNAFCLFLAMTHWYLDESGDLGFDFTKPKTTRFFTLTLLRVPHRPAVEKVIKTVYRDLARLGKRPPMLHAVNQPDGVRKRLLRLLAERDILVASLTIRKVRPHPEPNQYYTELVDSLLVQAAKAGLLEATEPFTLVASRRETNPHRTNQFRAYLERAGAGRGWSMQVLVQRPEQDKALQAVDFCSWAIFRRHEFGDGQFRELIRERLVEWEDL